MCAGAMRMRADLKTRPRHSARARRRRAARRRAGRAALGRQGWQGGRGRVSTRGGEMASPSPLSPLSQPSPGPLAPTPTQASGAGAGASAGGVGSASAAAGESAAAAAARLRRAADRLTLKVALLGDAQTGKTSLMIKVRVGARAPPRSPAPGHAPPRCAASLARAPAPESASALTRAWGDCASSSRSAAWTMTTCRRWA